MKKVSISVPCYNEEDNIQNTYRVLRGIMKKVKKYDYELIFTDNGSLDKTRELIKNICKRDKQVKGIFLSRNFGPEASGWAGLNFASGDSYVGIGCDLQDPPEMIFNFIKEWEKGFDIVLGVYKKTKDNPIMKIFRKLFYEVFNRIASTNIPAGAIGFGLLDKKVLIALKSLPEKYRFERGLISWIGFKRKFLLYERRPRLHGKSSYRFSDYLKHAERGLFGFSYFPLDVMVYSGFLLTVFSFLFVLGYLYWVIAFGNPINASIPILLAIVFFGGISLLGISILGKYIQVIVEETKNRPIYIVEDIINIKK